MELEEAKNELKNLMRAFGYQNNIDNQKEWNYLKDEEPENYKTAKAIEAVLQALENSIPKEAIKDRIEKIDMINDTIYIGERSNGKTFKQAVNNEIKRVLQELLEGK